jgi:flavin-dependent dehydrogenase
MKKVSTSVLVIGAGPSGCIASAYLNSQNIDVHVVEKAKFPRPVVGESLIPRVMDHFDEIGIVPALTAEGFEKNGAPVLFEVNKFVFSISVKNMVRVGIGLGKFLVLTSIMWWREKCKSKECTSISKLNCFL